MDTSPSPSDRQSAVTLRIPAELNGVRLDKALLALLPERSRTYLKELIEDGRVKIDGVVTLKPSTPIERATTFEVEFAPRRNARVEQGDAASLSVLFEDEALVVIDKPPGMLAHRTGNASGGTVSDLAVARYGPLPALQGADRPGIVHRLDAGTSGVMVLARTVPAFEGLMRQFREREVTKTYLALVYGVPRFDTVWIDAPLDRSTGDNSRMRIAAPGEGREAQTYYEVRERFDGLALIAAQPKTGRTHQIRVHMQHAGFPLVGDKLYKRKGGIAFQLPDDVPMPPRQCLHAAQLCFTHPLSNEPLTFDAPLAPDFARMLDWVREHRA